MFALAEREIEVITYPILKNAYDQSYMFTKTLGEEISEAENGLHRNVRKQLLNKNPICTREI